MRFLCAHEVGARWMAYWTIHSCSKRHETVQATEVQILIENIWFEIQAYLRRDQFRVVLKRRYEIIKK